MPHLAALRRILVARRFAWHNQVEGFLLFQIRIAVFVIVLTSAICWTYLHLGEPQRLAPSTPLHTITPCVVPGAKVVTIQIGIYAGVIPPGTLAFRGTRPVSPLIVVSVVRAEIHSDVPAQRISYNSQSIQDMYSVVHRINLIFTSPILISRRIISFSKTFLIWLQKESLPIVNGGTCERRHDNDICHNWTLFLRSRS